MSEPKAKKTRKTAAPAEAGPPVSPALPGRPSKFTQEIGDEICERLADGESLRSICKDDSMPGRRTVLDWLNADAHESFRAKYARAREAQADCLAEEIVDIADEEVTMIKRSKHNGTQDDEGDVGSELEQEVVFDPTAVARNRLRVDARKWYAAKLAPKKYGDKITQEHTGNLFDSLLASVDGTGLKVKP